MRIIPSSSMAKSLMEFDSKIFNQQVVISGVSINAQKVVPGDLFIALLELIPMVFPIYSRR